MAAVLPWAGWAALRVTGAERGYPLVPALSFTRYAALTAPLPLAFALRAGSRVGTLVAAGSAAALAGAVLGTAGPPVPRGAVRFAGPRLRVATVSLRLGLVEAGPLLDLVRRHAVDVLSVQELTPEAQQRLHAAGIDGLLPHSVVIPARPGAVPAASGAVWSRLPLTAHGAVPGGFEQPTVRLAVGGLGPEVELTAVHTTPPSTGPASVRSWTADLAALPDPAPGVLRVLAGDFNATLDHAAFRAVLRRGYRDAAQAIGRGLAWTWRPLRSPVPRLGLDHVLVDLRIAVADLTLLRVPGSDHRMVLADLALPPS